MFIRENYAILSRFDFFIVRACPRPPLSLAKSEVFLIKVGSFRAGLHFLLGVLPPDVSKLAVDVLALHLVHHICDEPCLLHDSLQQRGKRVVLIGPTEDLTDLLKVKALLRSFLEKGRGNPHVPEAYRSEAEGALEDLDIFHHIDGLYVS